MKKAKNVVIKKHNMNEGYMKLVHDNRNWGYVYKYEKYPWFKNQKRHKSKNHKRLSSLQLISLIKNKSQK